MGSTTKHLLPKAMAVACSLYLLTACNGANTNFIPQDLSNRAQSIVPDPTPIVIVDPTPAPTPVATPVATPIATPVPTPVATPIATPVATPVPTPVVVATPVPTPVPTPTPVAKSDCAVAGLSDKACQLLSVMQLGCQYIDEAPQGYVAPSRAQILNQIKSCSSTAYPDSTPTSSQSTLLQNLATSSFSQYMFTGSFYKPPYSDDFKLYFGIEIYNAIYSFCEGRVTIPGTIYPAGWDGNSPLPPAYQQASGFAQELNACVSTSLGN